MSGELHETVYDNGLRPNPASARDVLAFLLTPVTVLGPIDPDDMYAVATMLNEAKRQLFLEWQHLNALDKSR